MPADQEQDHPLAPASRRHQTDHHDDRAISPEQKRRRRNCIRWCGCITATTLVIIIVIVILAFTVFRVKEPKITIDFVKVQGLQLANSGSGGQPTLKTDVNVTLSAGVSIKNPNAASFKFSGTATNIDYDGIFVGYATTPADVAKARRTFGITVTVDVLVDKMLSARRLGSDLAAGSLSLDTNTKVSGRVNVINIIKKHVKLEMNCTVVVNLGSSNVQLQGCKRHVSL